MNPRNVAVTKAPTAQTWLVTACQRLAILQAPLVPHVTMMQPRTRPIVASSPLQALRHFCLTGSDQTAHPIVFASRIGQICNYYRQLHERLGRAQQIFRNGTGDGTDAAYNNTPRDGNIYITPRYLTACGPLTQVLVLIHEAAHSLSDSIQDYRNTQPRNFDEAIRNAHSFSECAFELVHGRPHGPDTE